MDNQIILNVATHPFRTERLQSRAPAGATLAELLGHATTQAHVFVGGTRVPRERWPYVRPRAGQIVDVRVLPAGGGNNKALTTVLQLAVLAASIYTGGAVGGAYGALASAGVALSGGLTVNAMMPA